MEDRPFEIWPERKREVGEWEAITYPHESAPTHFEVRREIREVKTGTGRQNLPKSILASVDSLSPEARKKRVVTIYGGVGPAQGMEGDGPHFHVEGTLEEVKQQVDKVLRSAGVNLL